MWKSSHFLIASTLILMALGIVVLASTSGIRSLALYDTPYFFVKRQAMWFILALLAGGVASRLDYHRWRDWSLFVFIGAVALLTIVLVPGIGVKIGGSRRWLHIGPFGFQPSEFAKFALVVILAWWISREQRQIGKFVRGAFIPAIFMGVIAFLVFIEPDFGTALFLAAVGMSILVFGGTKIKHLLILALPGLAVFITAVLRNPLRMNRIFAFLEPDLYAQTYSFQLMNALYAFTMGGGGGVGLGKGMQKHYYLPEAHTDFIFAIIGEELGVVATLGVLLLFAAIFICGLKISMRAPDMFGRLMAFGITMMITIQAMMNMAVVTGCLPTTGLPLPFMSFGGSCLLVMITGIGVLVNIDNQGKTQFAENDIRGIRSRFHDF